jgi:parallel beta-helix repeat protein
MTDTAILGRLRPTVSLILAAALVLSVLWTGQARASHSEAAPLQQVSGAQDCDPRLEPRDAPPLTSRSAIVIIGDVGPTGFIVGYDPVTRAPIPRSGAGVRGGTGTEADPYVIEGWLIEQATNAIRIQDTTAHVVIRENRLAHNAGHAVLLDNAANVTVTRNIIETNVGSGVHVEGLAPDVVVSDNALYANERGLSAVDTDGLVVSRNAVLESRGVGVRIERSSATRVEGNIVDRPRSDGMRVQASPTTEIACNRITNGGAVGIHLTERSHGSAIDRNRLDNHGHGILVSGSHETAVHDNHVTWSTGYGESTSIIIYESHRTVVSSNEASVARFGLLVRRSDDTVVEGNRLTAHEWGIFCTGNIAGGTAESPVGAHRTQILGNVIVDHQRSLTMRECDDSTVADNTMADQTFDGVHDFESRDNVYTGNTITGAERAAIYLWRFGGHRVRGNTITRSADGVRVIDSADNTIADNVFEQNHHAVIVRQGSIRTEIDGNRVTASTGAGIYLLAGGDAVVTRNEILGNDVGIAVGSTFTGGHARGNDLSGNDAGINVVREAVMDATDSWWGCPEGPGHPDCDTVHGNAVVDPWRTEPMAPSPEPAGPVAHDDEAAVDRGGEVVIDVLVNDEFPAAPADWASLQLLTEPRGQHRVVIERDPSGYPTMRFLAGNGGNTGRFDYEICDSGGRCDSATVTVRVQ